ncbi:MAG: glycogen synthase [Brevinemataceae bacterium]
MNSEKLRVLFASSEAVPFAKVGGLADMTSALSKALIKENLLVKIIIPKYRSVTQYMKDHHIKTQHIYQSSIVINEEEYSFAIEETTYKENDFIFIDMPEFFDWETIYSDPSPDKEYQNDLKRYVFFNRVVLETCKQISWIPNIIHCHDWHTGLIPLYMDTLPEYQSVFVNTKSVFTIHNLTYQGIFPIDQYQELDLEWKYFNIHGLEYYRNINLMKGGIVFSDAVNTVSPTYAQEIKTDDFGSGLQGVIQEKEKHGIFCGILNGVDYTEWDPENDSFLLNKYKIYYNYSKLENKQLIKEMYCKNNNIEFAPHIPLIGIITRLYDQKGIDIILEVLEDLLKQDIAFTILGTGKKEYENTLTRLAESYPHLLNTFIGFNISQSHEIEAASDMFLMPSRFEPCGLNQLYSLKYGTVPIVRKTGGLADSVKDNITGFTFTDYTPETLYNTIMRAVDTWRENPEQWNKIVKKGMHEDWSWKKSAKGYINLYHKVLKK